MYNVDPKTGAVEADCRTEPKPPFPARVVTASGVEIHKVVYVNESTGVVERWVLNEDGSIAGGRDGPRIIRSVVPGVRFVPPEVAEPCHVVQASR